MIRIARSPHGLALGHLFTVLVAAAVIVAPQDLAWGRPVGWQLTGTELLLEMAKIGQGPNPAGIYSWSSEGGFQRVVVYGRRPRWSPDHGAFLYWEGGAPWLAPRGGESVRDIALRGLRITGDVEWTPTGSHLVWKGYSVRSENDDLMSWYLELSPITGSMLPRHLTTRRGQEYVG